MHDQHRRPVSTSYCINLQPSLKTGHRRFKLDSLVVIFRALTSNIFKDAPLILTKDLIGDLEPFYAPFKLKLPRKPWPRYLQYSSMRSASLSFHWHIVCYKSRRGLLSSWLPTHGHQQPSNPGRDSGNGTGGGAFGSGELVCCSMLKDLERRKVVDVNVFKRIFLKCSLLPLLPGLLKEVLNPDDCFTWITKGSK